MIDALAADAAGQGVPLVGVVYDQKISSFLSYIGQDLYTDLDAVTVEALRAQQAAQEKQAAKRGRGRPRKSQKPAVKVYFLGGLNEIGKNFTVYECQGDMVIVDCGLSFPDEDMPGVDSVIPAAGR